MLNELQTMIFELGIIVVSSALIGTIFLYARQPIILAYIVAGIALGPSGLGLLNDNDRIIQFGQFGVILLLFLLGLNLQPFKLLNLFKESALITLGTCCLFFLVTLGFSLLIGLSLGDSLVAAAALMFSSTVIGLKLIPTTTLHHQRVGEVMTSVLLIQDILAIIVILFLNVREPDAMISAFMLILLKLGLLCLLAYLGVRYLVLPLFRRFDVIQEYTFVTALAWCLLWAETGHLAGLSYEIGAFVAGLSIAISRVSQAISLHLKPLREFFLILFFFAVGAKMDITQGGTVLLWGGLFGALLVAVKASGFMFALKLAKEKAPQELSARLSQASEFSLLLAYSALTAGLVSGQGMLFIQAATLMTFILSTYWVVSRFPTPISSVSNLRKD
ncbi:cation:proton antiporter [Photobacterium sp. 2_MG-2023]|uniref:cation:proton antiporter n=1 Tax=Photobacterium sp. 2_MG-2023 TaxID=3062663 RepID=UPI0026E40C30|nr:cation:proton antiporter [Photobacterium sp. 2_MG-2023]MDO6581354.1 cation:proton antiporter [Photobacterium sp. 2_MG-2023]